MAKDTTEKSNENLLQEQTVAIQEHQRFCNFPKAFRKHISASIS